MEKEKDTAVQPSDVTASPDDLLRRLRERYETDDQPGDIFDTDSAPSGDDESDEQDEALTRRIMEMFSSSAAVQQEQTAAPNDEPQDEEPTETAEETVDADTSEKTSEVEEAESVQESVVDEPTEEDEVSEPDEAEAFEDEVSDTALPDYDAALEDDHKDASESGQAPLPMQQIACQKDETENSEPTQEHSKESEEINDIETADAEEAEQPTPDAAAQQDQVRDAAPSEEHSAALPLSEGASVQEIVAEDAEAMADEPDEDADELYAPVVEPIMLREDEVLLDENEELPGESMSQRENTPEDVQLHVEASVDRSPEQPKQITPRPSPLDAALSAQRKKQQAEGGRLSAQLRAAQTLSEEDLALLLRLGYENELAVKQDAATLQRIAREDAADPLTDRQKAHLAYGWHEGDGVHEVKDTDIRDTYRKQSSAMTGRLILGGLVTLLVLLWDISPLYAHLLPDNWSALAQGPAAHLWGLQLLIFCVVVSGRRLLYGLRQLLRMTPEPCSVLLPVLLCNIIYDVIMCMQPTQHALLNFPTALLLLVSMVADAMDLRRERIAFSIVSANENKIVPVRQAPPKKKVVRGGRIVKIINDEADRAHYSVERVARLQDYFYRTNVPSPRYRAILPMLALQLLLSFGVTGVCTLKTGVTPAALTVLLLSLQLSAPASALFTYAYALLTACRRLYSKNATIVGQYTVDEMAARKQLVFAESEMLQAKSSTEIYVKGIGDPKRYVRYARRLFNTLGGTLAKINTSDLSEKGMDGLVEILRVYPDGVEARMDGRVHVLAGSSQFMLQNGIRVPHTNAERLARRSDESSILYLAFGGQIRLGYEINYRIRGSFEQLVSTLAGGKTAVAIRSYDPSITEEYLADSRADKKTPVRIIKPARHRKSEVHDLAKGGIVATENVRGVAYAVRMCERIKENDAVWVGLQWMTSIVGAVVAGALTWLSLTRPGIGIIAALLMALLCLPSLMISGRNLWIDTAKEQPKDTGKK